MRLEGKTFKANLAIQVTEATRPPSEERFVKQLERCLVDLCHQMNVPIPLWLEKNTHEFARFHQTIFFDGQFTEPVPFDRFQIRWLE